MEVDSVIEMFSRANERNEVDYINYVGDGDSKTFKGIVEQYPAVKKKNALIMFKNEWAVDLET